jgi:SAM-dependent methyltransferase
LALVPIEPAAPVRFDPRSKVTDRMGTTLSPQPNARTGAAEPSDIERTPVRTPAGLRLIPTVCCLCGVEDADPVGVGADFDYRTCPDAFLAVRCRRCGLVYLNPRPADAEAPRIASDRSPPFAGAPAGFWSRARRRLAARRVRRWCRGLPAGARILDVGCGDGFHLSLLRDYGRPDWTLEGVDTDERAVGAARQRGLTVHHGRIELLDLPANRYHRALMVMTLECLTDPVGALRAVRQLLVPGGDLVIVTDNAASADFALFGGRHWGGYRFPRRPYLFTKPTLAKLASVSGFLAESVKTTSGPANWVGSVRNWLDDWGAPRWVVNRFGPTSVSARTAATVLDLPLALLGYGSVLRATFRRPLEAGAAP